MTIYLLLSEKSESKANYTEEKGERDEEKGEREREKGEIVFFGAR